MMEFIEANIGFSVLTELSENKILLNHMREIINTYSAPVDHKLPNNG